MKNIQILFAGILLSGLTIGQCAAQERTGSQVPDAIRPTEAPDIIYPNSVTEEEVPALAPAPHDVVQPINRPDNDDAVTQTPEPVYLHQGTEAPANVTRPLEAPASPSIDRLYQNRIEVDQYAPVNPQVPNVSPPPGTMQPQNAPHRPGTVGGTAK